MGQSVLELEMVYSVAVTSSASVHEMVRDVTVVDEESNDNDNVSANKEQILIP